MATDKLPRGMKRSAVLPRRARDIHEATSKATLHEALLDLWLEHTGRDIHPADLTEQDWIKYEQMIAARSAARQRQG